MNLAADRDWIVPPDSVEVLGELVGSEDYRYERIEGAHVGIMIDPRSIISWTRSWIRFERWNFSSMAFLT